MILRIFIFLAIPFFLQAQVADSVIKKMQKKFATIEDLKADFRQSIYSVPNVESIVFEGKFYYKKENNFAIILPRRDIISDGESVWNYDKTQNKVVISEFDNENTTFSLNKIIYSYPEKCDLSLVRNSTDSFIIKAIPNDLDINFKEAYLTVSENYLLDKVEIIDFNNVKYIFELFSTKINQKISDSFFQFAPSTEVEVIDLR